MPDQKYQPMNWHDETTRKFVTSRVLRDYDGDPRHLCFYVDEEQRRDRGIVPMLVIEGQPGYRPMFGDPDGEWDGTWYWGDTIDEAAEICDLVNAELFGITREESYEIVDSSMNAQAEEDAARASTN